MYKCMPMCLSSRLPVLTEFTPSCHAVGPAAEAQLFRCSSLSQRQCTLSLLAGSCCWQTSVGSPSCTNTNSRWRRRSNGLCRACCSASQQSQPASRLADINYICFNLLLFAAAPVSGARASMIVHSDCSLATQAAWLERNHQTTTHLGHAGTARA
jgi:hypothetical protein